MTNYKFSNIICLLVTLVLVSACSIPKEKISRKHVSGNDIGSKDVYRNQIQQLINQKDKDFSINGAMVIIVSSELVSHYVAYAHEGKLLYGTKVGDELPVYTLGGSYRYSGKNLELKLQVSPTLNRNGNNNKILNVKNFKRLANGVYSSCIAISKNDSDQLCEKDKVIIILNPISCDWFPGNFDMSCINLQRFINAQQEYGIIKKLDTFKKESNTELHLSNAKLTNRARSIARKYIRHSFILENISQINLLNNINHLIDNRIFIELDSMNSVAIVKPRNKYKRIRNFFYNEKYMKFKSEVVINKRVILSWLINNLTVNIKSDTNIDFYSDIYGNLYINENIINELNNDEIDLILLHEVIHSFDNIVNEYEYKNLPIFRTIQTDDIKADAFLTNSNSNLLEIVLDATYRNETKSRLRKSVEEKLVDRKALIFLSNDKNAREMYCNILMKYIGKDCSRIKSCVLFNRIINSSYLSMYLKESSMVALADAIANDMFSIGRFLVTLQKDREEEIYRKAIITMMQSPRNFYKIYRDYEDEFYKDVFTTDSIELIKKKHKETIKKLFRSGKL